MVCSDILSTGKDKILNLFFEEKFHLNNIFLEESIILDPQSNGFKGMNSNIQIQNQNQSPFKEKKINITGNEYGNSSNNSMPLTTLELQKAKLLGYTLNFPNEINQNQKKEEIP